MAEKKAKSGKKHKGLQYDAKGEKIKRLGKSCPKCGAGVFMALHKDRMHCGKCSYMQKK